MDHSQEQPTGRAVVHKLDGSEYKTWGARSRSSSDAGPLSAPVVQAGQIANGKFGVWGILQEVRYVVSCTLPRHPKTSLWGTLKIQGSGLVMSSVQKWA